MSEIMIPAIAKDGTLFPIEKLRAHQNGQFHLAISVFVFDGDHLLLQRRAREKYHCGGLWANTCCTHPHWDEPIEQCANRRLLEELGFSLPLERHQTIDYHADVGGGLQEHERVTLFTAHASKADIQMDPNPEEVMDVQWLDADQLQHKVRTSPETFTPWFRIYLERFPRLHF